jgi:cell division protein FtsZ
LNLENSISVTVIATGFAPNQQDEIIHSDPKKIIHNLDENSGYVHKLSSNNQIDKNDSLQFDFASNSIDFKNTNPEIENSEKERIINDINVDYKEMNSNLIINEDEIEINDVSLNINEIEVTSPEELKPIDQVSFDFDMPLKKQIIESDKIVHELIEDINEIEVVNPVHIIPVTEVNGINANKSGIDDYEIINKTVEPLASEFKNDNNEVVLNPLNSSIADGLSKRTEERKIKLKQYNYNFTKANNIKSMENEPAFKRAGVSLDSIDQFKSSRSVISEDSNGEINLRTSNSFLHDNVD